MVHHHGGACVLAVTPDDEVYMVRQYRYALGEEIWELPAGKLEAGEDPFEAAKRELAEECGVTAGRYTDLGVIYPTVGYDSEKIYMWVAQDLEKTSQHLDPDEFLDVVAMPFATVLDMVMKGENQGRQDGGRHPEICAAAQKRRGAGLMPGRVRLAVCDLAPDWDPRDNYLTRALRSGGWELTFCQSPAEEPDFVLCGTFGHAALEYPCCRIQYSGEDSWPDLNLYDYAIGFPLLDYDGRYLRLPLYAMRDTWAPALQKHKTPPADVFARAGFCAAVVSNDYSAARNAVMDELFARGLLQSGGGVPQQHRRPGGGQAGVPARVPLCAGHREQRRPRLLYREDRGRLGGRGRAGLRRRPACKAGVQPRGLCLRRRL